MPDPAPKRIQRKRTKGWKMPPNTVYVGRPTQWGNPFVVVPFLWDAEEVVNMYRELFSDPNDESHQERRTEIRKCLRGKNLACFCQLDQPCHADVLLEIANA